jgi:hypothetical protein
MEDISNRVFVATLNLEAALLDALSALHAADIDGWSAAFEGIADSLAPLTAMSKTDREDALRCLLLRGRLSEKDWDIIDAAAEHFSKQEPTN